MASHFINSTISHLSLGHGDDVLLTSSGVIEEPLIEGITATGSAHEVVLSLHGSIFARNDGVFLYGTASGGGDTDGWAGNQITISSGAIVASSLYSGLVMYGRGNTVTNAGSIHAHGEAVKFVGDDGRLVNSGDIVSTNSVGTWIVNAPGPSFHYVVNAGLISGTTGIKSTIDTRLQIENTGLIAGSSEYGIDTNLGGMDLTNNGTISGRLAGINVSDSTMDGNRIINNGQINGTVDLADGSDSIVNTGQIDGNVYLNDDSDYFNGLGGKVNGLLDLGEGDDIALVDDPSGGVNGGAGYDTLYLDSDQRVVLDVELIEMLGAGGHLVFDDDTATRINGNIGNNVIMGNGGNDTIRGGQGLDELSGGDGDDLIIGNSGDDEIEGGDGADQIFGGRGADEIFGGYGSDTIAGGAGDDTISGGGAKDFLSGGYGADVFLFESAADAGSGAQADRIDNFVRGEDLIDLVGLGTTPASFIGTSGFSGGGNMEVRYTVNAFGNALVRIDEDGNGTEDARVVVAQTATLDAGDFLL